MMVVIAVVLGVLIGTRNVKTPPEGRIDLATGGERPAASAGSVAPATAAQATAGPGATATTGTTLAGGAGEAGATPGKADVSGEGFFPEYRLERDRARSRNIEILRQVMADEKASEEARTVAGMQLVDLSKKTEAEAEAEALIRARGYKDALVFVRGDACDVVVSGPELSRADAEQIGDIVARCLGVDLANITIVERGD